MRPSIDDRDQLHRPSRCHVIGLVGLSVALAGCQRMPDDIAFSAAEMELTPEAAQVQPLASPSLQVASAEPRLIRNGSARVEVEDLDVALSLAEQLADDAGSNAWSRGLTIGDHRQDVRRLLEHALHDSLHHVDDVQRGVDRLRR